VFNSSECSMVTLSSDPDVRDDRFMKYENSSALYM